MPIIRTVKDKNNPYTISDNRFRRDLRLSLPGRGLLGTILSLPPNWTFSVRGLTSICREGESCIRSTLKELEQLGYLTRKRTRGKDGKFGTVECTFYERSLYIDDNPHIGIPDVDLPVEDNAPQLINNILINKDINNPSIYPDGVMDRDARINIVRANIDYPSLTVRNPHRVDQIDEMVAIMADVMMMPDNATIMVGGNQLPAEAAKSQLQRLRSNHIEYVLDSMAGSATPIHNIHGYLLTAMYRAPMTMNNHYAAQVACNERLAVEGETIS